MSGKKYLGSKPETISPTYIHISWEIPYRCKFSQRLHNFHLSFFQFPFKLHNWKNNEIYITVWFEKSHLALLTRRLLMVLKLDSSLDFSVGVPHWPNY